VNTIQSFSTSEQKAEVKSCLLSEVASKVQKLAWRAIHKEGRDPKELLLFCIASTSTWSALAKHLNVGDSDCEENLIVWGHTNSSFYQILEELLPKSCVSKVQKCETTPGWVKYLIFDDNGIDIREVLPKDKNELQ
jgi:hypothetical protein